MGIAGVTTKRKALIMFNFANWAKSRIHRFLHQITKIFLQPSYSNL